MVSNGSVLSLASLPGNLHYSLPYLLPSCMALPRVFMKQAIQLSTVLAIAGLSACIGSRANPYKRVAVYDEAEYAPYATPGTGSISGQAFVKTRGGDVKYGAGNIVYLNPVTSYSTEWFEHAVLQEQVATAADERARKYCKEVRADGEGRFEFESLPAGEYYLACTIAWEVAGPYGLTPTGGVAHAKVQVAAGQHLKSVVVTK